MAIGFTGNFVYFLIFLCVILLKLDFSSNADTIYVHVALFGFLGDENMRGFDAI